MNCNCFVGYNKVSTEKELCLSLVSKSMLGKKVSYEFNYCPLCGKSLVDEEINKKTNIKVDFSDLRDTINDIFKDYEGDK